MKRLSFVWLLVGLSIVSGLTFPIITQAGLLPPCEPLPGSNNSCSFKHLVDLAVNIYDFLLGLAGLVALLFIIYAGIQMLLYHWSEDPQGSLNRAKHTLSRAVFGLIIIACSYLVVNVLIGALGGGDINSILDSLI